MASGSYNNPDLPSDEKIPDYSPYPSQTYPAAPGYNQFDANTSTTSPGAPNIQQEDAPGNSTDERRMSTESASSYDEIFKLTKPVEVGNE